MAQPEGNAAQLIAIMDRLSVEVERFAFSAPVTHVYNPLHYARGAVLDYLLKYGVREPGDPPRTALFLGMNPGPFGMAQTGVPFGAVSAVRDWLGVDGHIGKPAQEHPDRPITGFACRRSEVSGERLWGFLRAEFGEPRAFFRHAFVWNYCPLLFSEIRPGASGARKVCRNLTPDKIGVAERQGLYTVCDQALVELVDYLEPRYLVGVGAFAQARFERLFGAREGVQIERILHPSPASPLANRGFADAAKTQLLDMGLWDLLKAP